MVGAENGPFQGEVMGKLQDWLSRVKMVEENILHLWQKYVPKLIASFWRTVEKKELFSFLKIHTKDVEMSVRLISDDVTCLYEGLQNPQEQNRLNTFVFVLTLPVKAKRLEVRNWFYADFESLHWNAKGIALLMDQFFEEASAVFQDSPLEFHLACEKKIAQAILEFDTRLSAAMKTFFTQEVRAVFRRFAIREYRRTQTSGIDVTESGCIEIVLMTQKLHWLEILSVDTEVERISAYLSWKYANPLWGYEVPFVQVHKMFPHIREVCAGEFRILIEEFKRVQSEVLDRL